MNIRFFEKVLGLQGVPIFAMYEMGFLAQLWNLRRG